MHSQTCCRLLYIINEHQADNYKVEQGFTTTNILSESWKQKIYSSLINGKDLTRLKFEAKHVKRVRYRNLQTRMNKNSDIKAVGFYKDYELPMRGSIHRPLYVSYQIHFPVRPKHSRFSSVMHSHCHFVCQHWQIPLRIFYSLWAVFGSRIW